MFNIESLINKILRRKQLNIASSDLADRPDSYVANWADLKGSTLAEKALNLLKDVPEDQWITSSYVNEGRKACCAIGHLERLTRGNPNKYDRYLADSFTSFGKRIRNLSQQFIANKHGLRMADLASVNNDPRVNGYTEPVIKDRVIHLLTDMVEAGL